MRKIRKIWICIWMMAALAGLLSLQVHAKTLNARKYSLKNVMQAEIPEGEWTQGKSGVRFLRTDGEIIKNRWICVEETIYYVDNHGYRAKGWIKYRGRLYYMNKDGALHHAWLHLGKNTYYFGADGAMKKGRCTVDGSDYYFSKASGKMMTGWRKIGRYEYYFRKSGGKLKRSAWIKKGRKYCYVGANGRKAKSGWLTVGAERYYLDADGYRVSGTLFIGNKGYYFKKNGVYDPSVKVKNEVNPNKMMVALTFDDGPGPYTERLLRCLEQNNAKATFFMVGSSVSRYPSAVKKMAAMKCELGAHSWSHAAFSGLSDASIRSEVSRTASAIRNAAGRSPTVFRLPYGDGSANARVLAALRMPSIYWSIDTRDWANTGNPQHTVNEVLNYVQNGDIILMHDIHGSSVTAAETIIPALKKRGYQLVTVSQLAKYKGKTTLKNGQTYRGFR